MTQTLTYTPVRRAGDDMLVTDLSNVIHLDGEGIDNTFDLDRDE